MLPSRSSAIEQDFAPLGFGGAQLPQGVASRLCANRAPAASAAKPGMRKSLDLHKRAWTSKYIAPQARGDGKWISVYLTAAGAAGDAGVAGTMPPIICIHIAGSKGVLIGAGAVLFGAAAGAEAGIKGKKGMGAACAGAP